MVLHDQAADIGGNERCFQAILDRYPRARALAPHFRTTIMPEGHVPGWARRTELIGRGGRRRGFLAPLYARRVAGADLGSAALVLSLTHNGASLGARVPPGARHVCYTAGLPGLLWGQTGTYLRDQPRALRPLIAASVPLLRADYRRLTRLPDRVVANSLYSVRRLEAEVGVSADMVHPPVRTHFFTPPPEGTPRAGFLAVARLTAQKRLDLLVEAFRGLDETLVIAGDGPQRRSLERLAPRNVRFAGAADDDALLALYRSSRALICPSIETFGIAMGEALATGIPVVGSAEGGAPEIVRHRENGLLLDRVTPQDIAEAVRALASASLDGASCRHSVERFAEDRFAARLDAILREEMALAAQPSEAAGGRPTRLGRAARSGTPTAGAAEPSPGGRSQEQRRRGSRAA